VNGFHSRLVSCGFVAIRRLPFPFSFFFSPLQTQITVIFVVLIAKIVQRGSFYYCNMSKSPSVFLPPEETRLVTICAHVDHGCVSDSASVMVVVVRVVVGRFRRQLQFCALSLSHTHTTFSLFIPQKDYIGRQFD
jgi:hypothetical protein